MRQLDKWNMWFGTTKSKVKKNPEIRLCYVRVGDT